jgi:TRAP-type C4-dicarboxylate transport system substrate-binding protein
MKRFVSTMALAAAIAAVGAAGARAETKILFSPFTPPGHVIFTGIVQPWGKDVERVTEGRVKVTYPSNSLAPPPQQWEMVTNGIADAAFIFNGFAQKRLTLVAMAHLPFTTTTAEATSIALWRTYEKFFQKADEYKGVHLLGLFTHPGAQLFSLGQPIVKVSDIKGMKVWASPGPPAEAMGKLGAAVVSGPAVRMYEIVSKGTVDAYLGIPYSDVKNFKIVPYTKGVTEVPGKFGSASFSMFMNAKTWASLSKKDQDAITGVSGETIARHAKAWDEDDKVGKAELVSAGAKIVPASDAFVADLHKDLQFLEDNWLKDAAKVGVDGKAALAFFRAEAKAAAAK